MKGGRRLFLIASAAGRALLCSCMAMYISKPAPEGLLVYPLAFGVLVLPEGQRDRQERARAGPGEGRRRAGHRQLAPGAHQRGRRLRPAGTRRSWCTSSSAPTGRCGTAQSCSWSRRSSPSRSPARRRREPADEQQQQLERQEMHTPSILLGRERVRRAAGERRLPGRSSPRSRSRTISSRSACRRRRRPYVGNFGRRARRARAPPLGARGGDPRVVARAPRRLHAARRARRRARSASCSPRSRSGSAPRPGGSASTACCSATAPMQRAVAPSPSSRPASSSCG